MTVAPSVADSGFNVVFFVIAALWQLVLFPLWLLKLTVSAVYYTIAALWQLVLFSLWLLKLTVRAAYYTIVIAWFLAKITYRTAKWITKGIIGLTGDIQRGLVFL